MHFTIFLTFSVTIPIVNEDIFTSVWRKTIGCRRAIATLRRKSGCDILSNFFARSNFRYKSPNATFKTPRQSYYFCSSEPSLSSGLCFSPSFAALSLGLCFSPPSFAALSSASFFAPACSAGGTISFGGKPFIIRYNCSSVHSGKRLPTGSYQPHTIMRTQCYHKLSSRLTLSLITSWSTLSNFCVGLRSRGGLTV